MTSPKSRRPQNKVLAHVLSPTAPQRATLDPRFTSHYEPFSAWLHVIQDMDRPPVSRPLRAAKKPGLLPLAQRLQTARNRPKIPNP